MQFILLNIFVVWFLIKYTWYLGNYALDSEENSLDKSDDSIQTLSDDSLSNDDIENKDNEGHFDSNNDCMSSYASKFYIILCLNNL